MSQPRESDSSFEEILETKRLNRERLLQILREAPPRLSKRMLRDSARRCGNERARLSGADMVLPTSTSPANKSAC
jgi:predicted translin family RNA/ssDNA-binding protein